MIKPYPILVSKEIYYYSISIDILNKYFTIKDNCERERK